METVYDRFLLEIGQNGYFQKKFDIFYNFLFATLWGMAYTNIFLALVIIPHRCQIPENFENISDIEWKSKYIPISNNISGKLVFSSCLMYENPVENNHTKDCDNYYYDQTWYESTVASSNNWVCKEELKIANTLAISKIGEAIGSLGFGWFGDTYGRRWTYILSLVFLVIGRIISIAFSYSFTFFVIGCVLAWIPSWSVVQTVTVISMEISSPECRSRTATLRSLANSSSMFIMPFLYWWLRDWKIFMIVTTATQLPFLFYSWKMIESPRWLWIQGKSKACVRTLKIIAKENKTRLGSDTEKDILDSAPFTDTGGANTIIGPLALFSGRRLAINTILQSYLWISVAINYTVLMMKSGEKLDGNPFLEFAWQSAVEVPGTLFGAWLADRVGRRYAGVIPNSLTVLSWVTIAFHENSTSKWYLSWLVGTSMTIFTRLSIVASYYVIYLFNMELYPTCLRQSGMSLGNLLSSGGGAIAPYLLYLVLLFVYHHVLIWWYTNSDDDNKDIYLYDDKRNLLLSRAGHKVDLKLLYLILSGISFLGCISFFLLPETLNTSLPETLKDAQEFGKDQRKYFSFAVKHSKPERSI